MSKSCSISKNPPWEKPNKLISAIKHYTRLERRVFSHRYISLVGSRSELLSAANPELHQFKNECYIIFSQAHYAVVHQRPPLRMWDLRSVSVLSHTITIIATLATI
jgi:hypothetical protein